MLECNVFPRYCKYFEGFIRITEAIRSSIMFSRRESLELAPMTEASIGNTSLCLLFNEACKSINDLTDISVPISRPLSLEWAWSTNPSRYSCGVGIETPRPLAIVAVLLRKFLLPAVERRGDLI